MKKTSSQLLYVHHSQQNNPTGLSPAEPVSILSYRSGFQLDQNRNYEFRVKSVKASLSGINTADTQAQALLNAFRTDFITFLSVITDENQLVINNLRPALHTADAGTLVDTNTKQVVRQGKAPLLAHTHLFECKREMSSSTSGNVWGDYYLPIPQATSRFARRSDPIPINDTIIQMELPFKVSGQSGYLVPNFVSHNMTSSIDVDFSDGNLTEDYEDLYQDEGNALAAQKISIYNAQLLVEVWEE